MDFNAQVLKVLKASDKPMKAQEVADALGADKALVSKAFKEMKATGEITSPKACFYSAV